MEKVYRIWNEACEEFAGDTEYKTYEEALAALKGQMAEFLGPEQTDDVPDEEYCMTVGRYPVLVTPGAGNPPEGLQLEESRRALEIARLLEGGVSFAVYDERLMRFDGTFKAYEDALEYISGQVEGWMEDDGEYDEDEIAGFSAAERALAYEMTPIAVTEKEADAIDDGDDPEIPAMRIRMVQADERLRMLEETGTAPEMTRAQLRIELEDALRSME